MFYAPAFAGLAWLRWREAADRKDMQLRLCAVAVLAVVLAAAFIGTTIWSLPDHGTGSAGKTLSTSGSMMFDEGFFPRWHITVVAIMLAPLTALLIVIAPGAVMRAPFTAPRRLALIAMMLPLTSIIIYRNSFPYFYAYILPPVMIAAAVGAARLIQHARPVILGLFLVANAAFLSFVTPRDVLPVQKEIVAAIHDIFPQPVSYFDYPGMIVNYRKANLFMTGWGMKKYRVGAEQPFIEVLSRETVPLMLLNHNILVRNQTGPAPAPELLPEDGQALRDGFISHWGPIWVAGRRFSPRVDEQAFRVYTPGLYTLEGARASIDGHAVSAGDTVMLTRGMHRFSRIDDGESLLRWGDHLEVPLRPFSGGKIFDDF